jgi:hypothetical protein
VVFFENKENSERMENEFIKNVKLEEKNYLSSIFLSQDKLKIDHEWRQYKITFHENTKVRVSLQEQYCLDPTKNLAYCTLLTDGGKPLPLNVNRKIPLTMIVSPMQGLNDWSISSKLFKKRVLIGGKYLSNITAVVNETKNFEVKNQTEWFYTVGVYSAIGKEKNKPYNCC